jgi:hypothetical protein
LDTSAAPDNSDGLGCLATLKKSIFVEKLLYTQHAKTYDPILDPRKLVFLAALAAMSASKLFVSTSGDDEPIGSIPSVVPSPN